MTEEKKLRVKKTGVAKTGKSKTKKNSKAMWRRMETLVVEMLQVLEEKMNDPEKTPKEWEVLFASKDSVVINLQKLAKLMGDVQGARGPKKKELANAACERLTRDELKMLEEWLRDTKE